MANTTGLIPTGDALKGKKPVLHIKNQVEVTGLGRQSYEFGALLDAPTKMGDKEFPLTGWLGDGKTLPVVAEFNPNPEKAKGGETEKPAIRIYAEIEGDLREVAIGFRQASKTEGKGDFYTGNTTGTPKKALVFFKHEPKAE